MSGESKVLVKPQDFAFCAVCRRLVSGQEAFLDSNQTTIIIDVLCHGERDRLRLDVATFAQLKPGGITAFVKERESSDASRKPGFAS